ncbi:MAG: hypothetical protein DHS20C08_19840 [Rhodomicrobium sp.]|nr:MAG: hypothetical protein DHS20C08_19840 [Rhodomicrobium sp.]
MRFISVGFVKGAAVGCLFWLAVFALGCSLIISEAALLRAAGDKSADLINQNDTPIDIKAVTQAQAGFPALTGRVVDAANILSPQDEAELTEILQKLEGRSTDQIVVVTVPSLNGISIDDYGNRLGRHWGIGQAGKDNGVLLIVAPQQRRVRIEVGYGLEGVLPDALAGLIVQRRILPFFKRGDLVGGIKAGVNDIRDTLLGDAEEVKLRSRRTENSIEPWLPFIFLAFWIVPFVYFISSLNRDRRVSGRVPGGVVILPTDFGAAHDQWRGPGGFSRNSGGFGGGFSGGGGSFGGGGASGGW